jgi:hypothetical protein
VVPFSWRFLRDHEFAEGESDFWTRASVGSTTAGAEGHAPNNLQHGFRSPVIRFCMVVYLVRNPD